MNRNSLDSFDSSGAEHIPKEIRKFIGNINLIINIYRTQAYDSIMRGYFCIGFIDFMLKGKSLQFFFFLNNGSVECGRDYSLEEVS